MKKLKKMLVGAALVATLTAVGVFTSHGETVAAEETTSSTYSITSDPGVGVGH